MENQQILYQLVKIPSNQMDGVLSLIKNKLLKNVKKEFHVTFDFFGSKNTKSFNDSVVFPYWWVAEKKKVEFIVESFGDDGMAQGLFLSFHPDTDESVRDFYRNERPPHVTLALADKVKPMSTGFIAEECKTPILAIDGSQLTISGYVDVFTKRGFLSPYL